MATHEVEVKPPYGTKNEVETRVYTAPGTRAEVEVKPPYGQKNEAFGTTAQTSTPPPQSSSFSIGGSRSDVEVKPYGTQETLIKQRTATTGIQRPLNLEQWKNPLMATLLGITLALTLLSLSYLPRMISGAWHWGTSWLPSWHRGTDTQVQPKSYDAYDSATKSYIHDMAGPAQDSLKREGRNIYEQGKQVYEHGKQQAADMINNVRDSMPGSSESLYEQVKQTGERVVERAKSTIMPESTSSMTLEARKAACQTAQKARDVACEGLNLGSGSNIMDDARATAQEASNQATGMFQQAKMRASDILEHAKDAVLYPLHAAQDTAAAAKDKVQAARDTVVSTGGDVLDNVQNAKDRATGSAAATVQAAKDTITQAEESLLHTKDNVLGAGQRAADTVTGAAQAVKEKVFGAGQTAKDAATGAKDTVLNAGQAAKDAALGAKDKVVNAGQQAAEMASSTIHSVKDSVTNLGSSANSNVDTTTTTTNGNAHRGPTRVKVEVQEL